MTANEEIIFDKTCGIAVEEQQEILSRINSITEKNKRSLSSKAGITEFKAKKTGRLFPSIVNISAILILAIGVFLLFYLNKKSDITIREGDKTYTSAERALIDEIRKETALKIETKEKEIISIQSKLEDVDNQIKILQSGNKELTQEQRAAQERLLSLQNAYRIDLASSYQEKAQILEDSRSKEARLRAQFEESAAAYKQTRGELNTALEEIDRIGKEHDRAAAIDSYIAGSLKLIHGYINKNQLPEAAVAAQDLREFLETGAFQSIRTFMARKEMYIQAVNTIELMIKNALVAGSGALDGITLEELRAKNAKLEQTVNDMQTTLDSFKSGSSGQAARLIEIESSLGSLRNENSTLQSAVSEKDRTISGLQSDKTELTNTITVRDNSIRELQSRADTQAAQITDLNSQLTTIRQALQALSQ